MEFLRRRIGLILQVLVSVLIIAWLTRIADWHQVWTHMRTMDPRWIIMGLVCFLPTLGIVSYRWRMLLAVHGVRLRFWRIFELTMIGQFFGTIGLGTTGGDVAKVFYAARAVPTRKSAVAFTIIVDRVIGLVALLLFGAALSVTQLPLLYSHDTSAPGLISPKAATNIFFFFAIGGLGGGLVATLLPYLMENATVRELIRRLPFVHRGANIYKAYETSARALGTNLVALLISIPSHICSTLMGFCVIKAMAIPVDHAFALFAMIAMVNMLVALPISVGGVGVRESLFVAFLGLLGIDHDHAIAFSITCFAMGLFWSIAGGPFYYLYRHETHTPPPTADEVDPLFEQ